MLAFARLTGDDKPLQVDAEYARHTRFGRRIACGTLLVGIVSKVLGRDFPGHGSVAVASSCHFLRPVPVCSEVTIEIAVSGKTERRRHVGVRASIYLSGKTVLGGEMALIPPLQHAADALQ